MAEPAAAGDAGHRQLAHIYTLLVASSGRSVYKLHMNSREIIRVIEAEGWSHVATKGDHWQFRHPTKPGRVTVPHPKRDLPIGTLRSIERQAGVKLR